MNIGTEQVFIVNATELDQQNQHAPTPLQRAFAMPVAVTAMQPEEAQTSMCLAQSMGPPSRTQTCRLCATVTELVVPIFQGEGLQNNLADKIHQHLPIQVSENDLLPVVMCFQCTSTLLAWHELVVCSVQADSVMRKRFNLTFTQHQQQQQANVQSNQNQIKDEKCDMRSPRACVRCEHCAGKYPDTHLRAHLLAAHAPLLFLCAECDLYRSRGDMITHMATHIEHATNGTVPEESVQDDVTKLSPKPMIPVVRIQRVSAKLTSPPPLVKSSVVSQLALTTDTSDFPSVGASETVTFDPPPLRKLDSRNAEGPSFPQVSTNSGDIENEDVEPANDENAQEQRAETDQQNAKDTEKTAETESPGQVDEFSDHSDTENDFGRLPESVFDAIEDSQDDDEIVVPDALETGTKKLNWPRACRVCEKQSNSLSGWYYHLKRAHGTHKNFACEKCDKAFASRSELSTHVRTHTKEKPFACRTCSGVFASRAGRYIHERTHTETRTHVCARCACAFRWRAQLRRHEARHDAAKRHVCKQCGRGFSVAFDLTRHVRAHSPGCHRCDVCGATFKQKRYLKVHMENIHLARTSAASDTKKSKKPKRMVPALSAPDKNPP